MFGQVREERGEELEVGVFWILVVRSDCVDPTSAQLGGGL